MILFLNRDTQYQIFFFIFKISFRFLNMASKAVYTTSCTIRCPSCSKSMLLKNWKDHCRQMHTMLPSIIDAKYNEIKKDIEKSRSTIVASDVTTVIEKPIPITTNTLFSMKKFALTKSANLNVQIVGDDSEVNPLQSMELDVQHTPFDSTKYDTESSPSSSCILNNINENSMISYNFFFSKQIRRQQYFFYVSISSSNLALINLDSSTTSINNILSCTEQTSTCENGMQKVLHIILYYHAILFM